MRSACLALTSALALPGIAHAWTGLSSELPVWSTNPSFFIHSAGSTDLGGFAASEGVARQAMEDWSRVSCTSLRVEYLGPTSVSPTETTSEEVIGWVESDWFESHLTIGVTATQVFNGEIVTSRMALNGVHYTWINGPGSGNQVDAYSIILHEGGHFFGLGHSSDPNSAMFFAYNGGVLSLSGDDEAGICTLYPGSADCEVSGCPVGLVCEDSTCVTDPNTVADIMCSPCASSAECGGGACLNYPTGSFCGTRCSSNNDCLGGDSCFVVSDGSRLCVRENTAGTPDCTAVLPPPGPEPDAGAGPPDADAPDADSPDTEDAAAEPDAVMGQDAEFDPKSGPSVRGLTGSCSALGTLAGTTPVGWLVLFGVGVARRFARRR